MSVINEIVLLRGRSEFQVTKAGLAGLKIKTHFANRPITMLRHYYVRNIFTFRFRVIDVVTINKHDDVRVLLQAVMHNDVVSDKIMQVFYCQIVNFRFTVSLYGKNLIPIYVALC